MGLKLEGAVKAATEGLVGGTVYISLHTGDPTDANEISGNNYARLPAPAASFVVAAGTGRATLNDATFQIPSGAWADSTHFALNDELTAGDRLFSDSFDNNPDAPAQNAVVGFTTTNDLVIIPPSTPAILGVHGAGLFMKGGIIGSTLYIGLHSGDPGASGQANELSGNGYARVPVAANGWTQNASTGLISNNTAILFANPTAAWADATWVTANSSSSGGNQVWRKALDNNPDAATPGNRIAFAIGQLSLAFTLDS